MPLLRELLLTREPSGLHHARCRAAEALATLKAYEVLDEFLRLEREIDDPVERLGEETVISSAARAIARSHSERTFNLLLDMAKRRVVSGVIAGLGSFKRLEAIPCLVEALAEDEVRLTAEAALREMGAPARTLLVRAAKSRSTTQTAESESSLRKRRSALALLIDIGKFRKDWPALRDLMVDSDAQISFLACSLALRAGDRTDKQHAISRLTTLRGSVHWLERLEIDRYLEEFTNKRRR